MFQMGVVLLVAFMAAAIALRLRLSAIVGYMAVGILLGPHLHVAVGPLHYDGVLTDTTFLAAMSQLGLILLLFFVGLNFPMSRLRRAGTASATMAAINLVLNMFSGIALGLFLQWPIVDTIFLAGVLSMSSSSVTAKSLMDLQRLGEKDTDFLLGMVILESFMAMFLLTAVNGMVLRQEGEARSLWDVTLGMVIFVGFFAFLAVGVIPRVASLFHHMQNDELFILSALGIVLLSAALAEAFYIPSVIGAFFIGMAFADTKLHDRLAVKMESLRDAFVAFFFLSFGMAIDPALFPQALPIVLVAIPLILLNDFLLTGLLAYLMGFRGQAALDISSGMVGRNEEAVLYASVGTRAIQSNSALDQTLGARLLNPIAGMLCMITSALAPILMRRTAVIASALRRSMPRSWRLGGEVVRQGLRAFFLPPALAVRRRHWGLTGALLLAVVHGFALLGTPDPTHLQLSMAVPATVALLAWTLARNLGRPNAVAWPGAGVVIVAAATARALVLEVVVGAIALGLALVALWPYAWWAPLALPAAYLAIVSLSMGRVWRHGTSRAPPRAVAMDGGGGSHGR